MYNLLKCNNLRDMKSVLKLLLLLLLNPVVVVYNGSNIFVLTVSEVIGVEDILFKTENRVFSYRVAGILIHKGKLLLQRPLWDTGYAFPGGHVSFGETNEDTLIREMKEEIGIDIKVGPLKWVAEIFFSTGKKDYHQICLYYLMSLESPEQIPMNGTFNGLESGINGKPKLEFSWVPLELFGNLEVYPVEVKQLLPDSSDKVIHFISRENPFNVRIGTLGDLDGWMNLVRFVKDNFPGLETEEKLKEYEETVIKNMKRESALVAIQNEMVVGVLLFSPNQKCLSCLAVHPGYRRRGIATALVQEMLTVLSTEEDISVETFRQEDILGIAPRALYKKLGFIAAELSTSNDYPVQKFILRQS